ncbi:hypothetical protein [Streptomyces sp. NBC_01092]|uniref:hypothetical protein n=1 Tax=Streptomyces sp. NBC_01092 TaxID=2903748 RepID=UPI0038646D5E|nr:hypothetical protein OG254_18800 [Streptomyces sp. NBC_01092]
MGDATATVVAGGIGLIAAVIGAVIAGRYAERGAKAGGRKAVEAALAQVQGQAAAEHWQWVRSQRYQSFASLLAAYTALDDVLAGITPEVRGGVPLDVATKDALRRATLDLQDKTSLLALWGPDEARALAYALTRRAVESVRSLLQAEQATSQGRIPEWSNYEQARGGMNEAYATFLQRAGEIVRDPMQAVS